MIVGLEREVFSTGQLRFCRAGAHLVFEAETLYATVPFPCASANAALSIAHIASVDATPISFVAQLGTPPSVVDEPVADLSHADAGCLECSSA